MKELIGYKPKHIIVRMPNWIGDLIMGIPVLHDLKRAFPHATLTAMCKKPLCDLLMHDPFIDEVYCFSIPKKLTRRQEKRDLVEKIKKGKYDLGILLTNSFSSAWYFRRGHVTHRIGYRGNFRSWLLTEPLNFPKKRFEQHLVITYKELLAPLGIPVSDTKPRLFVTEKEERDADMLLKAYGISKEAIIIGINPGAAYGSAKCWIPERFREVALKLLTYNPNVTILFFGDEAGAPLIKKICQDLPPRIVNLAGVTTLRELMALINRCHVFLTNDSGPMHIAAALNIPLVALFGSTSEVITGPYEAGVVIHKKVSCSPCFKRTCPIDFRCMTSITTDNVFEKLMDELERQIHA